MLFYNFLNSFNLILWTIGKFYYGQLEKINVIRGFLSDISDIDICVFLINFLRFLKGQYENIFIIMYHSIVIDAGEQCRSFHRC